MASYLDVTYTNGVIAAKEKYLLKDKISRFCELSAEEAFRALLESGFGGGAETTVSVYDYEKLILREEEKLDAFIREFAPSEAEQAYLLSSRDFHNAKALVKAAHLQTDAERMLASEGLLSVAELRSCVETGNYAPIREKNAELAEACEQATECLREEPSGSKVGEIFEKALYTYLFKLAKRKPVLKKLLQAKIDRTNILTAFRAADLTEATEKYLPFGKLTEKELSKLFNEDMVRVEKEFSKTPYGEFVKLCLRAKEQGLPMTQAEKLRDGYDVAFFAERKYELQKTEPFLYYVYRRKTEHANVRIVFVCLLAGQSEQEIKQRLRAW